MLWMSRIIALTLSLFVVYNNVIYASLNDFVASQYTITPSAGPDGSIIPSTPLTVYAGSSIVFTAKQNAGYMPSGWYVDGQLNQNGGVNFLLSNINANHTVKILFEPLNLTYAGGSDGYVYWSMNGGLNWSRSPAKPNPGQPINSLFASNTTLFASAGTSVVYYSTNNGVSWLVTAPSPDKSAITSIFVTPTNTLYVGTANGNIYYSNNLCNWTAISPPLPGHSVNSIYVVNNATYAGVADGNVYYAANNLNWKAINGTPDGSAIQSVFATNQLLYVNTANQNVFTSSNLTGGGSWNFFAQTVNSLCVDSNGSTVNAATQDGYVYSLMTGNELGFIANIQLNTLFCLP